MSALSRSLSSLAIVVLLPACAWLTPQPTEQPPRSVTENDRWNLAALYASDEDWKTDLAKLNAQIDQLTHCEGRLGESAAEFQRCMDLLVATYKRRGRLRVFANSLSDEDTRIAANLERLQTLNLTNTRLSEATSFVNPEILRLGERRMKRYFDATPALAKYRHYVDNILRQAPHVLDQDGEALLATLSLAADIADSTYGILTGADMPWPDITIHGETVRLDKAAYTKYRADNDREVRTRVFDAFWGTWKDYERTLGGMLYGNVREQVAMARARSYDSARAAALDSAKIPLAVYDTLIDETHANLGTLHRYFRLRGRMLGIDDLQYQDIYPPLVFNNREYPIAEGKQMVLDAVQPLGPDYVEAISQGFANRWMDVYPQPGKRSGAYMNPGAYDVHPFVLMNYNDDFESVSTLAHEWGHAMHSDIARRNQAFLNSNYSIFTAEIASTLNEFLLSEHLLSQTEDDELRLFYLGQALEMLRGTYFRQTMFGEFERDIHTRVEAGESLSGASLSKAYCELLKRYHGHDEGVLTITDRDCVEWAYIPHFYYNFYVYQYATSVAAASLLADRILADEPGAQEQYLALLAAGGSDYPYELLRRANIDMASPAPYRAMVGRMNRIMDEIEAILARRDG